MAGKKSKPENAKFKVLTEVPPHLEIDDKAFGGFAPYDPAEEGVTDDFNQSAGNTTDKNDFLASMMRNLESENYDGDEDGDGMDDDEDLALAELADEWMPLTPECENIRDHVSNYELRSLVAARILRDEFEGRLPEDGLDSLMAAMLALGAENCNELFNEMGPRTLQAVEETIELIVERDDADSLEGSLRALARGTPVARLLMLASVVADLEIIWDDVSEDESLTPDEGTMEGAAEMIRALARPGDLDQKMLERAAEQFNLTSDIVGHKLTLRANRDGTVDIITPPPAAAPKKPKPPGLL